MKVLSTLFAILLLSLSTPSYAADSGSSWRIYVPDWIENITDSLSERVDAVVDNSVIAQNNDRDKQVTCLALAVYYEARGEPLEGQKAVAAVVMNRVNSPRFPDTACEVVFQPRQFSFVGPRLRPTDRGSWSRAVAIANTHIDMKSFSIPYMFFNSVRGHGHRIGAHFFY